MTTPLTSCPNGHQSTDAEWCDTCGAPLGRAGSDAGSDAGSGARSAAGAPSSTPSAPPSAAPLGASGSGLKPNGPAINCPSCGDPNPESNLFCESCGLDFVTGQAPTPPPTPPLPIQAPEPIATPEPVDPGTDLGWSVTLTIDTDWFAAKGEGIGTPPTRADRVEELRHSPLVIGRTRSSGKSPGVVIDDDHGISRRHAELTHDAQADTWSITDLGSTNGTFVVASDAVLSAALTPVEPNSPVLLVAGDQVFVGAWTRLTLVQVQGQTP
jgi:FHA domain